MRAMLVVAALGLLMGGCDASGDASLLFPELADLPPTPELDPEVVERGAAVYASYCSACHGSDLSGVADWKTPGPDGRYLPPPHDETGHTWHHSDSVLVGIIADGSDPTISTMPGFDEVLTDGEIADVVAFLKSGWDEETRRYQWQVTWLESQRE